MTHSIIKHGERGKSQGFLSIQTKIYFHYLNSENKFYLLHSFIEYRLHLLGITFNNYS